MPAILLSLVRWEMYGGKVFRGIGVRIGCQVYIAPHCSGLLVGDFVSLFTF